jgi:hypothetical protein
VKCQLNCGADRHWMDREEDGLVDGGSCPVYETLEASRAERLSIF